MSKLISSLVLASFAFAATGCSQAGCGKKKEEGTEMREGTTAPLPPPPPTTPTPTPTPAPAPTPVAVAATAAAPAPVRVFEPPAEESADVADPNLFGEFGGAGEPAGEASLIAEDEASATRIELAKAYLAIGDLDGARSMLEEVLAEGGAIARAEAARILKEIG